MAHRKVLEFSMDWVSVGIDLVEVERFYGVEKKKQFLKNVFTQKEIKVCKNKGSFYQSLSARFAAKEAVKKSLKERVRFNEIEIVNEKDGRPKVNLLNKVLKQKYKLAISITHTKQFAQAICLAYRIK